MAASDNSLWMRATALALACGALACGSETATQAPAAGAADTSPTDVTAAADAGDAAAADPWAGAPPEKCAAGAVWDGKAPLFEDITKESGLADQNVVGIRLSGADLDGDLRPELFVRSMAGAGRREDFTPGKRLLFLLKAKPGPKGFAFDDITQSSGVLQTRDGGDGRQAHVVVYGDADNDGQVDVFAGNSLPIDPAADKQPGDASELMLGNGKGQFALTATPTFADPELRKALTSASFVDYDRDGNLDLWLGYSTWGPKGADLPVADQLLRGDGKGGFSVVTTAEGLITLPWKKQSDVEAGAVHRITWGTAACDVNGDGAAGFLAPRARALATCKRPPALAETTTTTGPATGTPSAIARRTPRPPIAPPARPPRSIALRSRRLLAAPTAGTTPRIAKPIAWAATPARWPALTWTETGTWTLCLAASSTPTSGHRLTRCASP
jgi:hypothetical protein